MTDINDPGASAGAPRPPSRRWCVPPAILRDPHENLDAEPLLHELRGELGLLLWEAARDVALWAAAPVGTRAGLFSSTAADRRARLAERAAIPAELRGAVATFTALLRDPVAARAPEVCGACGAAAAWAERAGHGGSATCLAQAAALADPSDADACFAVGLLALRNGNPVRAESWLRRTIAVARRAGAWVPYTRAHVETGLLLSRRGAARAARRFLLKSLRAARRHAVHGIRGRVLHELFHLARAAGRLDEADRLARNALRSLGRGAPSYATVLRELAEMRLSQERFTDAYAVLRKRRAPRSSTEEEVLTDAVLAMAAAGVGEATAMATAWDGAWVGLDSVSPEKAAVALDTLEKAAAIIGDWKRARMAARRRGLIADSPPGRDSGSPPSPA